MYLTVVVLNKEQDLSAVLEKFNEIGIIGATILESKGMGRKHIESEDVVFGGLRKLLFDQARVHNKTIFLVVNSREEAESIINHIENTIGTFDEPGTGIAFALPLSVTKGCLHNQFDILREQK